MTKVTFTLDHTTVDQIASTATRLGLPRSGVVREAVAEFAARADRLTEAERLRLLAAFDELVARIPRRPARQTQRELAAIAEARRAGGRRTPAPNR